MKNSLSDALLGKIAALEEPRKTKVHAAIKAMQWAYQNGTNWGEFYPDGNEPPEIELEKLKKNSGGEVMVIGGSRLYFKERNLHRSSFFRDQPREVILNHTLSRLQEAGIISESITDGDSTPGKPCHLRLISLNLSADEIFDRVLQLPDVTPPQVGPLQLLESISMSFNGVRIKLEAGSVCRNESLCEILLSQYPDIVVTPGDKDRVLCPNCKSVFKKSQSLEPETVLVFQSRYSFIFNGVRLFYQIGDTESEPTRIPYLMSLDPPARKANPNEFVKCPNKHCGFPVPQN